MHKQQLPFKKLMLTAALVSVGSTAMAEELILEEVMVTAQKRTESLQDTPIAITALSADALETNNISDMTDLRGNVPSLNISPFAATRAAPMVFIRGMGSIDAQSTRDNAVGVYLDGVVLGRASGLATDIADIERIEVLRGPQGTLYGRNTTGGAINFITSKPNEEFAFKQQLSAGNYGYWASKTTLNTPLTDKLFGKIAYLRSERDGWVENTNNVLPNQIDLNEDDKEAGNIALRFEASENFVVDYSYDFSNLDYGNGYYQITDTYGPNGPYFIGNKKRLEKTVATQVGSPSMLAGGMEPSETEIKGHNLTLSWMLDNVTLKSISSYRELDDDLFQNYNDLFIQTNDQEQWQLSQEFQAIGSAGERFEYVAGLYFFKEDSIEHQNSLIPSVPINDIWTVHSKSESYAAYGQGTWTPDILEDRMRLTLGLRYTEDDREASKNFSNHFGYNLGTLDGDKDFSKFNPTFTVDYAFSDDVNGYAKVATGYRAGGFGTRSTYDGFTDGYDEENLLSYEFGVKSDLYDKRVRLNAALFFNNYEDLQISQKRDPEVLTDILNAGEATINGLEVELTALLTEGLTLDFYYVYLDAEYDEYLDEPDPANNPGVIVDLADERYIANAPDGAARLGLEYALKPLSYGQYIFNLDYQWQDETYSGTDEMSINDSYGLVNARAQLSDIPVPEGSLRIALWAKNLADEEYTILTTNFASADGFITSMFGTPRTYGLDVIYEY